MTDSNTPQSSDDTVGGKGEKCKKGRCPRCSKTFDYVSVTKHKAFPFCSSRCRDVDLGKWITGAYSVPGESIAPPCEDDYDAT